MIEEVISDAVGDRFSAAELLIPIIGISLPLFGAGLSSLSTPPGSEESGSNIGYFLLAAVYVALWIHVVVTYKMNNDE